MTPQSHTLPAPAPEDQELNQEFPLVDHNTYQSLNLNLEASDPDQHVESVRRQIESLNKNSLGYSESFNVVQETIDPKEQDWNTVRDEVESLKNEIAEKTAFYRSLREKFLETEEKWQEERKGLLAEISLMRAKESEIMIVDEEDTHNQIESLQKVLARARERIRELEDQPGSITVEKAEIARLHQEVSLREMAWVQERSILCNQMVTLRNEIGRISLIHRKETELEKHILNLNQQMAFMARDIHEGRRKEELYKTNIGRLTTEVEKLSLVHQKTDSMELQLQKLTSELGRMHPQGEFSETKFRDTALEENTKSLQKRIYILEAANYNLSQEIKRNREVASGYAGLEETITRLKIEVLREQLEKQNVLNQVEVLRQKIQERKEKVERAKKRKVLGQDYAKKSNSPEVPQLNLHSMHGVVSLEDKIRQLRQETRDLKNNLTSLD